MSPSPFADLNDRHPASLAEYWMPFTANRQFKKMPRLLASAAGMYYRTVDGGQVLDGTAGLWCVNAGHARAEITAAVTEQLAHLDYAPSFQMGHPLPFVLAERMAAIAPGDLDRVFFTNSGSEAVDTALKIALAYHQARGDGRRTRLIGREKGYHGVNFGGISVGGMVNNRKAFGPLLPGTDHLRHTLDHERNAFSRGLPRHGGELADDLVRLIELHDASTIAAVIVEPISGSAGVILPPEGYLQRLRELCTENGILLIFDEVITGFGRVGAPFAAERFGVVPDMITCAKGLTNGAIPMGAVLSRRGIQDALMQGPEQVIELFHGYTYSGHPVACAAALAALDIYRDQQLFQRALELEAHWQEAALALREQAHLIDIRAYGLMAGIDLEPRPDAPAARGYDVFVECLRRGLLIRVTGDTVALSPPLVIEKAQIDELFGLLAEVIDDTA